MTAPVKLELNDLSKNFGGVAAVDHLQFTHDRGGVLGLIGPNGAGKTTLFNMLSGVIQPTSGMIVLDDKRLNGLRPDRIAHRGVARTFQNLQVFGSLSALENVSVAAAASSGDRSWQAFVPWRGRRSDFETPESTAQRLLNRVGVGEQADDLVSAMPYGLQRRVEFARALAVRPRLLLLDEPLAGLSQAESVDLAQLMRELSKELTVVLVEHDMATVMRVSDRVIVLDHGALLADGTPAEVQANSRVRAAYLGEEETA